MIPTHFIEPYLESRIEQIAEVLDPQNLLLKQNTINAFGI